MAVYDPLMACLFRITGDNYCTTCCWKANDAFTHRKKNELHARAMCNSTAQVGLCETRWVELNESMQGPPVQNWSPGLATDEGTAAPPQCHTLRGQKGTCRAAGVLTNVANKYNEQTPKTLINVHSTDVTTACG
jgi:hypothetical protein